MIFLLKAHFSPNEFDLHERNGMLPIAPAVAHVALNWGWGRANYPWV